MLRKTLLAVAGVILVAGAIAAVKVLQIRSMMAAGASFTMPPETVSGATVRRVEWESVESAVGTVSAVQGVMLRSEVQGLVKAIRFESGQVVREGDVLVELDRLTEEADLRSALARAELARANLARMDELSSQLIMSRSSYDSALAAKKEAEGQVDAIRSAMAKKVIRAPFSGRVGIRQIQLGQFADVGTPIVTLQSVDPVHVDFTLPERLAAAVHPGMPVRVTSDGMPGRVFEGALTAVSPEVDASSRSLKLQATLTTGGALLPGMFARVELVQPRRLSVLVVPVTSVLKAPYGDSVFVLEEQKDEKTGQAGLRARLVNVTLGETRGDLVVVESGLTEGQLVAGTGVFKLSNGAAVVVNDSLAPEATEAPHPKES